MTTQFASASYQEIIDLKTTTNNVSIIGLHTPTNLQPYKYLRGFFTQFKKYRYNGCSMTLVPAARLPADISQVGYGAGEPPIDARDILNPVMFHGCHGNSMGTILDQFLNGPGVTSSFDTLFRNSASTEMHTLAMTEDPWNGMYEKLYYRALTDNTWLKANPQSGFRKRGLHPLVYDVSTNHAIGMLPTQHTQINPVVSTGSSTVVTQAGQMGPRGSSTQSGSTYGTFAETTPISQYDVKDPVTNASGNITQGGEFRFAASGQRGLAYFTSRLHRLGWLDSTVRVSQMGDASSIYWMTQAQGDTPAEYTLQPTAQNIQDWFYYASEQPNQLPLLYMGLIMLPPAYKANQYMRLILNHSFSFKGFRGISTNNDPKYEADLAGGLNYMGSYRSFIPGTSKGDFDADAGLVDEGPDARE